MTASVVKLTAAAEDAVVSCLPVLPIVGSDGRGYEVSRTIHGMVAATPEEWATAALAIAELHAALYDLPSPTEKLSASAGPYELEKENEDRPVPLWVPIAIGIALAVVIIIAGVKL